MKVDSHIVSVIVKGKDRVDYDTKQLNTKKIRKSGNKMVEIYFFQLKEALDFQKSCRVITYD